MAIGFSPEFFMRAAGVVEFTLAFALVCTPLVRRLAAPSSPPCSSAPCSSSARSTPSGIRDRRGAARGRGRRHSAEPRQFRWRQSLLDPALGYGLALAAFLTLYYATHAALLGTAAA